MKNLKTLICALMWISITSSSAHAGLFGHRENEQSDISAFKKWESVHEKYAQEQGTPAIGRLQTVIDNAQNASSIAQKLAVVNRSVNHLIKYRDDKMVWGTQDYWASPAEALAKGQGDCDDYALMKFFALREAGVSADDMRIVILKDNLHNQLHAVLAVNVDGTNYILDNWQDTVFEDTQNPYYKPIFALSESRWWRFS